MKKLKNKEPIKEPKVEKIVPEVVVDPKIALRERLATLEAAFRSEPNAKAKGKLKKAMSEVKAKLN